MASLWFPFVYLLIFYVLLFLFIAETLKQTLVCDRKIYELKPMWVGNPKLMEIYEISQYLQF